MNKIQRKIKVKINRIELVNHKIDLALNRLLKLKKRLRSYKFELDSLIEVSKMNLEKDD